MMSLGACFVGVGRRVFHGFGVERSPRVGVLCAAHVLRQCLTALAPPLLRSAEHPNPQLSAVAPQRLPMMSRRRLQDQSSHQVGLAAALYSSLEGYLRTEENVVPGRGSEVKGETVLLSTGGGHERTRPGAAFDTLTRTQSFANKVAT